MNPSPQSALSFYLANRPIGSRATIEIWRPTVLKMIEDKLPCKIAHAWMVENQEKMKLPIPAEATLRDWMTKLRAKEKEQKQSPSELSPTERDRDRGSESVEMAEMDFRQESAATGEVVTQDKRNALPADSKPVSIAEKLAEIKQRQLALPLRDRQQWEKDFLQLQIEKTRLSDGREPDSADIDDMKKGLENIWKKFHRQRRSSK